MRRIRWSWLVLVLLAEAAGIAIGLSVAGVGLDLMSACVVLGGTVVLGVTMFMIDRDKRSESAPKTAVTRSSN